MILASIAGVLSVVVGGISQNVAIYMISAAFLGVFFALQSGTLESVVYDTVLEETGDSEAFELTIGRVRLVESVALVASALVGGAIAQIAPPRATYFLTAPLLLAATVVLLLFREPQLHKAEEWQSLRRQVATTYRTILARGHLRAVVALTVVGSVLMQGMLEFGPLWLVALLVPAFLYGPHWAGLTSALGLGGLLGAQAWITRRWVAWLVAPAIVACCVVLAVSHLAPLVVAAQVLLTLLVVAVSIPVMRRLHDAVPSGIRAGVASGVGTLTWLTFVPFALRFGFVSDRAGVDQAGWLLAAIAVVAGVLMAVVVPRGSRTDPAGDLPSHPDTGHGTGVPERSISSPRRPGNGQATGHILQRPGTPQACACTPLSRWSRLVRPSPSCQQRYDRSLSCAMSKDGHGVRYGER